VQSLVLYVSGHGFGHAARQQAVIRALAARGARVYVRSAAPAKFFREAHDHHSAAYDVGLIQPGPLLMDAPATAAWYADFLARQDELAQAEADFARRAGAGLIASDMPPFACEVAERAGLPCVVLTHFTWDWVYEHYVERVPAFAPIIASIRASYGKATLALQMPFAHDFGHFRRVEPIPLVVNAPTQGRDATRAQWGAGPGDKVALISMGGHGWRGDAARLAQRDDWRFWVMPQLWPQVAHLAHCTLIPTDTPDYHNLIAAADVVVGKAGGSTVAEVVAHQTAMLYTVNDDWRENELLMAALARYGRAIFLPREPFERGSWIDGLDEALALPPPPEALAHDGAEVAAERLLTLA
jgi:L-arabinokinase